jgi:hypothetical protein
MSYQSIISEILSSTGHAGQYHPHQIEAYMRLQYGTLDHLSRQQFVEEVELCRACIDEDGPENAEKLADTYGLRAA